MGGGAPPPYSLVSSSSPLPLPALPDSPCRLFLALPPLTLSLPVLSFSLSLLAFPLPLFPSALLPTLFLLVCLLCLLSCRLRLAAPAGVVFPVAPLARLRASTTAKTPPPLCLVPVLLPLSPPLPFSLLLFLILIAAPPSPLSRSSSSTPPRGRGLGHPAPGRPLPPWLPPGPWVWASPLTPALRLASAAGCPLLGVPKRFWGAHPRARLSAGWGASSPRGLRRVGVGGCARAQGPRGPGGLRAVGGRFPSPLPSLALPTLLVVVILDVWSCLLGSR